MIALSSDCLGSVLVMGEVPGELNLTVRVCSFVVQLLPLNPVFVSPTMATEVFHFIYLLFIPPPISKDKRKART